jgi:hypothetical protein
LESYFIKPEKEIIAVQLSVEVIKMERSVGNVGE